MTYSFDGYNYTIRLDKGEHLLEQLQKLATDELKGKSVWLQGLGGAAWAELGFYDLAAKTYHWQRFNQPTEITSLQGNLAWWDDQPTWHIHATLADGQYRAIGGHVKELEIAATCELHLHSIFGEPLRRTNDEAVGLPLLDL